MPPWYSFCKVCNIGQCIPFYFDTRGLVFQGLSPCDKTLRVFSFVWPVIILTLYLSYLLSWRWRHWYQWITLHGITSLKTVTVVVSTMRTSDLMESPVTGYTVNCHDSVIGRVTGNFSLHHYIQNHMGTDSASIQWIWVPFLGENLLKEWTTHLHLVEWMRLDRALPHAFIVWNLKIDITYFCLNQVDSGC